LVLPVHWLYLALSLQRSSALKNPSFRHHHHHHHQQQQQQQATLILLARLSSGQRELIGCNNK